MAYERKEGDIVLFRNNKRETDQHPVMRGEALIGGVTYEVALWGKTDRNGSPFWTGVCKKKEPRTVKAASPPVTAKPPEAAFNDDIPF